MHNATAVAVCTTTARIAIFIVGRFRFCFCFTFFALRIRFGARPEYVEYGRPAIWTSRTMDSGLIDDYILATFPSFQRIGTTYTFSEWQKKEKETNLGKLEGFVEKRFEGMVTHFFGLISSSNLAPSPPLIVLLLTSLCLLPFFWLRRDGGPSVSYLNAKKKEKSRIRLEIFLFIQQI